MLTSPVPSIDGGQQIIIYESHADARAHSERHRSVRACQVPALTVQPRLMYGQSL